MNLSLNLDLRKRLRDSQGLQALLLSSPTIFWLGLFFLLPLVMVVVVSFGQRGEFGQVVYDWTLENYTRLADFLYLRIFARSVWMAVLNTGLCLLFGYPLAYFIARSPRRWRYTLLLLVLIPFWTNFLVRTYAWIVILRKTGVLNALLQGAGLVQDPLSLFPSQGAVLLGLFYGYLPFMVLPLYAAIERLDMTLVEAAQDLGANAFQSFRRVVLPLTMPGVLAGSIIVFIPSVGAYVIPELLGGAKVSMIGNVIQQQFLEVRNWPFGSAMGLGLMVLVLAATVVYMRTGARSL